jgi:hypothetical protein
MTTESGVPKKDYLLKLTTKILEAVDDLITLRIITAVGLPKIDGEKGKPEIDFAKANVISTKINLLQGDITTLFDPVFVTGGYQCLREFHAAREKEGSEIVQKNIAAIRSLIDLIRELEGEK